MELHGFREVLSFYSRGPVSIGDNNVGNDTIVSQNVSSWGYGAAGTYYFLEGLQLKLSYEKLCVCLLMESCSVMVTLKQVVPV